MERSKTVEAEAVQRPEFGAFFQSMDQDSVTLRRAGALADGLKPVQGSAHAAYGPAF